MANKTPTNSTDGIITPEASLCVKSDTNDACENDMSANSHDKHCTTPIKTLRNRKRNLSLPTLSESDVKKIRKEIEGVPIQQSKEVTHMDSKQANGEHLHKMEKTNVKIILGFLLFVQVLGECDCEVPSIIGLPSYVTASENISIGSVLFTFNATVAVLDEEIVIHTNGPDTANIVFVNQTRGNDIFVQVITKTELDRDGYGIPGKSRVELEFQAVDLRANMITVQTVLYLTDVNDNAPQLHNLPYHWSISEHFHFGNESYDKVSANDFDAGINGMLRYRMEPITKSESLATEYRATFTMDTVTGVIKLERNLDYEKHNIYHFNITATDENGNGRTSEYAVLTIRVLDVQDTPPIFTSGSYTALLHNNLEVNSLVLTVNALDGDTGYSPLNDVDYSILQGPCSELFSIDKQGGIRTTKPIGDNIQAFEPSCVLTVSAQEVDVDPSKQYGSTKTETTVRMVLESKEINHESCSSGTRFNAIMSINFAVAAVSLMLKTS